MALFATPLERWRMGIFAVAVIVFQSLILGLIAIWVFLESAQERRRLRYGLYEGVIDSPWGGGGLGEFHVHEPEPSAFAKWKERRAQRRADDERRRKRELRGAPRPLRPARGLEHH